MSDKPKIVEARSLAYCEAHNQGVVAIRDEEGNTYTQPYTHLDPDFPPPEGPVLQVSGGPSEDGWYKGQLLAKRGPSKVNSDAYRRGWERIFGNKITEGEA